MNKNRIKIAGIVKNSIVDGRGIRYVVFAQGCPHKCENCHNPHTHDFSGGEWRDVSQLADEIRRDPLLDGVTFSGGEPFFQAEMFAVLAEQIHNCHIICYSGYTFEELYQEEKNHNLLKRIDVLIDGRFIESEKSMDLQFKGSRNQRTLNSKESLKFGKAIEIIL
ncbi:MAG: anaerobic ribonucleoside-triphosphate reductase activating protein [Oscillospiraceae bacterium]|nr:anaerobic ribonucleoside-triphosphate reductase activating protein [Oscillospiraceae bacterium]